MEDMFGGNSALEKMVWLRRQVQNTYLDLVKEVFRMPTTPLVSTAGVPAPEAEEHFEQLV